MPRKITGKISDHRRTGKHRDQEVLSKKDQLLALYRVIAVVTRARNLERAYDQIVKTVSTTTGFEIVAIELYLREERMMEFVGYCGIPAGLIPRKRRVPLQETLGGVVVTTGKPVVQSALPRRKELNTTLLHQVKVKTFVSVPLKVGGTTFGALSVASRRGRVIGRDFVRFITTLAEEIARLIDRRLVEERVRLSEGRYRQFFDGATDTIIILDPITQRIMDVNPQATNMLGFSRKELIGRSILDLHPPDERDTLHKTYKRLRSKRQTGSSRSLTFVHKKGRRISAEVKANIISIDDRKLVIATARDITEQKKAEVKLAASEELLRLIVEGTQDMFFYVHDVKGIFTYVSPSVEKITGHPVDAWKTHYTRFTTSNPINEQVKAYTEATLKKGTVSPAYLCEIYHADGRAILLEINERPILRDGKVIGIQGVATDITERKMWERNLMESEEKYRTLFDSVRDGIFQSDGDGKLVRVNKAGASILGYRSPEEVLASGVRWPDLYVRPEDRLRLLEELSKNGFVEDFEFLARRKDNTTFCIEGSGSMLANADGTIIRYDGTFRDVTDRKRLEDAIIESHDFLNRILAQIPLAVEVFDPEGNLVDVNEAMMRFIGIENKEEIIGKLNVRQSGFLHGWDLRSFVEAAFKGETVDIPAFSLDPMVTDPNQPHAGTDRTIHARLFPVFDRNANIVNVVVMIEDVTDKRKLEEQLFQSQKMESIGLLAGGIAHDFNNILGGILGYASYLKTGMNKDEKIYSHLETIERSALRAAELTSQLLAFARGGKYDVRPIDLNLVVEETLRLLRGSLEKSIVVEELLTKPLPAIEADAGQMQQVLMNLCVNARDAMPGGGKLVICTSVQDEPDDFLRAQSNLKTSRFVRATVTDSGIGIDKAIMARIFEPFFTTKEKGKGTGLGLATVYGIIRNHGGYVDVQSEIGSGTSFTVYLPAVVEKAISIDHRPQTARGGNETVLVVDDEDMIRMLAKDLLGSKGYTVLEASNGQEALDIYAANRASIDLIILDMAMPGLDGREVFIRLKDQNPDVQTILSTGYAEDERAREMMAQGVKAFVQKPYRAEEFAAAVRRVLDEAKR